MDREKKHPIAAALAAAADVPITVFADLPEVMLSGGREIRILRHHGVRESLAAAGRIDGVTLLRQEVRP